VTGFLATTTEIGRFQFHAAVRLIHRRPHVLDQLAHVPFVARSGQLELTGIDGVDHLLRHTQSFAMKFQRVHDRSFARDLNRSIHRTVVPGKVDSLQSAEHAHRG